MWAKLVRRYSTTTQNSTNWDKTCTWLMIEYSRTKYNKWMYIMPTQMITIPLYMTQNMNFSSRCVQRWYNNFMLNEWYYLSYSNRCFTFRIDSQNIWAFSNNCSRLCVTIAWNVLCLLIFNHCLFMYFITIYMWNVL